MQTLACGTIPEITGLDRTGHVILGGLPLAKGQLRVPGRFNLIQGDKAFPVEGTAAAWWPDGSIKWLRLCGAVDLKGGHTNPFTLEAGAPAVVQGLVVCQQSGVVEVRGGRIFVRVSSDPGRVLEVHDLQGKSLTRGSGLSARMRLTSPQGETGPVLSWTFTPGDVKVVEANPARVVIRLGGRFEEAGRLVGELVTFIEVVKDEPRLGIQPVWIYLGDPDRDLVRALTVSLHTVFGGGKEAQFGFGQDRGAGYWDACQWLPEGHRWPQVRLVQAGSSFYRLDKRTRSESSWVKIREGGRAQGWCHLGDSSGGVTGAMRYLWQEYPRTLMVDADEGTITFGLIPMETEPLDLRRYSPVILGDPIYEAGGGSFPAQTHGATGIAKSNELMVHFHAPGGNREEAAQAGLFWVQPARLIPDPESFASSGVAGGLAAKPPPECEAGEKQLADRVDFLLQEREVRGWYGWLDYGDVMMSYYSDREQWAFDDGGYAWVNTESLVDLGLWLMALRHGRPDWLEGAIAMTRHNRDVDMYHRGNFKGVGSRHNVNHWGCKDKEWRISMPLVKRFHDYLTGDPWTREVILETVAVYQSYERTAGVAPSMASALAGLMVKAEMTGVPDDIRVLHRAMDVWAGAVRWDGHFAASLLLNLATGEGYSVDESQTLMGKYFFLLTFGGQHVLTELAETYGHEALAQALIRHADLYFEHFDMTVWKPYQVPCKEAALPFLALAWRRTREARYRVAIQEAMGNWQVAELGDIHGNDILESSRARGLMNQRRRNKVVCALGDLMHLSPYGYGALGR